MTPAFESSGKQQFALCLGPTGRLPSGDGLADCAAYSAAMSRNPVAMIYRLNGSWNTAINALKAAHSTS